MRTGLTRTLPRPIQAPRRDTATAVILDSPASPDPLLPPKVIESEEERIEKEREEEERIKREHAGERIKREREEAERARRERDEEPRVKRSVMKKKEE